MSIASNAVNLAAIVSDVRSNYVVGVFFSLYQNYIRLHILNYVVGVFFSLYQNYIRLHIL